MVRRKNSSISKGNGTARRKGNGMANEVDGMAEKNCG